MPKAIQLGDSALPPPGDERREVLAERKDKLEEAAEKLAAEQEIESIDPSKLKVDRELANLFDPSTLSMLTVSNAQPGFTYTWQNAVNQSGLQVMMKKYEGWEVVSANDPEAREHKTSDGTRRVADVLLMRISNERKAQLDRRDEIKRERIQRGVASDLEAMGRKYAHRGLKVHTPEFSTDETSRHRTRGFSEADLASDPRRRMMKQQATEMLGNMAKEKIPGVPLPGEGKR